MKVSNPLTIIAIFAGLAEALATIALLGLPNELQEIFIYFVMAFPSLIVILFFVVLYFNNNVLYAPGDYQDPEHYLKINSAEIQKALNSELMKSNPLLTQGNVFKNDTPHTLKENSELTENPSGLVESVNERFLRPALKLLIYQLLEKPSREREKIINSIESQDLKEILVSVLETIKEEHGEDIYLKPTHPTTHSSKA
ncbi:hypothetical protein [Pseudomonas sp. EL_65y_Pfl2_R95]|uniref:hypothetical protein n=1 Tax=Pseudomonas sp. EL_65y_Pfl2_R95 TaxID=3088698 RepID=UPI0030D88551